MYEAFLDEVRKHDSVVISGHVSPDGDCYGSQIALREALRALFPEKRIAAIGSGQRRFFELVSPMDSVDDETLRESLVVLLDANGLERMEDPRVRTGKAFFKIDHHRENGSYHEGGAIVDENAASSSELIGDLIRENNIPVTKVIANALYLGNLTDSGHYRYVRDFPRFLDQMSWLSRNGADIAEIERRLAMTDLRNVRFHGYIDTHFQTTDDGVIYLVIPNKTVKYFHLSPVRAASAVASLENITHYPVAAFFAEDGKGGGRMEFRSSGPDVFGIAASYGGGGHELASGAPMKEWSETFISKVLGELGKLIRENGKGTNENV